ncbi:MAG TPA: FixG Ig-like domain-containing protein, partial [Noviherbaspirillum sp.]|nr:FixG Ig-like domain-containing protein [Noviherbaspirillum sp.]
VVENVYRLQIMNMDERPRRVRIAVSGADAFTPEGAGEYDIGAASMRAVAFRVRAPDRVVRGRSGAIEFRMEALDAPALQVRERSMFRAPAGS